MFEMKVPEKKNPALSNQGGISINVSGVL